MPPKPKKYYAVRVGRHPGIYITWPEAQNEVSGFEGAVYKSFTTLQDAQEYMHTAVSKLRVPHPDTKDEIGKQKDLDELLDTAAIGQHQADTDPQSGAEQILQTIKTIRADTTNAIDKSTPDTWNYHQGQFYLATDGSFNTKSRKSGWAVYLGSDAINLIQPMPLDTTNNRCELLAIQSALECVLAHQGHPKLLPDTHPVINIVSDSQLCVNTFTKWISGWKKKGWKLASGEEPKNLADVKAVDSLLTLIHARGIRVEFIHQRAHTSGNTIITTAKTQKEKLLWQINYIVDVLAQQLTN